MILEFKATILMSKSQYNEALKSFWESFEVLAEEDQRRIKLLKYVILATILSQKDYNYLNDARTGSLIKNPEI